MTGTEPADATPTGTVPTPTGTVPASTEATAPDASPSDAAPPDAAPPDASPVTLDCRGQRCPLPVIALARRLPGLPVGATLRVLADDPAAASDIPAWCRMRGQEFRGAIKVNGTPAFEVRRLG